MSQETTPGSPGQPSILTARRITPDITTASGLSKDAGKKTPLEKFTDDRIILSELLRDMGGIAGKPEVVQYGEKEGISAFQTAFREDQVSMHHKLIRQLNGSLRARFFGGEGILYELNRESGMSDEERLDTSLELKARFANGSRREQLQITRDLQAQIDNMFLKNFDLYIEMWREFLLNTGISPKQAQEQIDQLENAFLNASPRGAIGISRELRRNINSADQGGFIAMLEFWKSLKLRLSGRKVKGEEWIKRYQDAPIGKKRSILNSLINDISRLQNFDRNQRANNAQGRSVKQTK